MLIRIKLKRRKVNSLLVAVKSVLVYLNTYENQAKTDKSEQNSTLLAVKRQEKGPKAGLFLCSSLFFTRKADSWKEGFATVYGSGHCARVLGTSDPPLLCRPVRLVPYLQTAIVIGPCEVDSSQPPLSSDHTRSVPSRETNTAVGRPRGRFVPSRPPLPNHQPRRPLPRQRT